MRRRMSEEHRRRLDLEVFRIRRTDAVDALADAAAYLEALRAEESPDPLEMIVAESRLEAARKRFWDADEALRARHSNQVRVS